MIFFNTRRVIKANVKLKCYLGENGDLGIFEEGESSGTINI